MQKSKTKREAHKPSLTKNSKKSVGSSSKKANTHKELLGKIRRLLDRFDNK